MSHRQSYQPLSDKLHDTVSKWRVVPDGDGWAIEKDGRRALHFVGVDSDLHAQRAADKRNGIGEAA